MRPRGRVLALWALPLLLPLLGCERHNEFIEPPPPEVTVARPLQDDVQEYFQTTGQTQASQKVELRARVSGYLKEIRFEDGQMVSKGDLLFVIDKAPYEAAVASANAAVEKAQAQLALAERQLERTQRLVAQQAGTQSDLDIQLAEAASANANVAAAKAALREAELDLNDTEIIAPFAGRMGRHLVDIGNLVLTGETMLATLESVDPIYAYFSVSETDLLRFMEMRRQGELNIGESDPLTIELGLGESQDYPFKGKLDFREFGVDPTTGTTLRRASFANEDASLIPGLFVRVRAQVGDPRPRWLVEERAISADQRGEFVLIVNDENIVEQRIVKLGIVRRGMRVIESGLTGNERVVVVGLQRARIDSTVNPTEVPMGADLAGEGANQQPETGENATTPSAPASASSESGATPDTGPARTTDTAPARAEALPSGDNSPSAADENALPKGPASPDEKAAPAEGAEPAIEPPASESTSPSAAGSATERTSARERPNELTHL